MPAQQLPRVAVNPQRQRCPAVTASLDAAHVGRPARVRCAGHRRQGLNAWTEANRSFADLSTHELKDPLNRGLVELQQMRHRSVAKRWGLLDHRLDRLRGAEPGPSVLTLRIGNTRCAVAPRTNGIALRSRNALLKSREEGGETSIRSPSNRNGMFQPLLSRAETILLNFYFTQPINDANMPEAYMKLP